MTTIGCDSVRGGQRGRWAGSRAGAPQADGVAMGVHGAAAPLGCVVEGRKVHSCPQAGPLAESFPSAQKSTSCRQGIPMHQSVFGTKRNL